MSIGSSLLPKLPLAMVALAAFSAVSLAASNRCLLPSQHAGVSFPVEQVRTEWACRLQPIISHHTTANKIGPIRTLLSQTMYVYLLDHPTVAATLINRLDLGLYRAEVRGPGRFWGNDGEGAEGLVELVYQDRTHRIYYLEGSQDSRLLPHLSGKAVLFLSMRSVKNADGTGAMDTTIVSYAKLDNRVLSGVVSLLRPLVGGTVTRKLLKGVQTVNRLSEMMRREPDRVLMEAADPPGLSMDDVAFLQQALATWHDPSDQRKNAAP